MTPTTLAAFAKRLTALSRRAGTISRYEQNTKSLKMVFDLVAERDSLLEEIREVGQALVDIRRILHDPVSMTAISIAPKRRS